MHDLVAKDLFNWCLFRGFAFERYFPSIVTLGNDADEFSLVRNQQSASVFFRHHLDSIENHGFGGNRPNLRAFMMQEIANFAKCAHARYAGWLRGCFVQYRQPIFAVSTVWLNSWSAVFMAARLSCR